MNELKQIIELWKEQKGKGNRLAMATLVSSNGPSYRSPGAMALIVDDGACRGSVSAGCLEKDIACRLDSGTTLPFLLRYDLSLDDDVRGFPFGCGGDVEIFVEPLAQLKTGKPEAIEFIENSLKANNSKLSVLMVDCPPQLGLKAGARLDAINLPEELNGLKRFILDAQIKRKCSLVEINTKYGIAKAFIHFMEQPVTITIFGDSEDARILESLAFTAGFEAIRYGRKLLRNCEDLTQISISDYIVIMNHDLNLDRKISEFIFKSVQGPKYLGLLGPRSRSCKFADLSKSFVYAPVGLDLAAETPGEIALSILAEIQSVSQRKVNNHLRDRSGAIHERHNHKLMAAILAAGSSSRLGSPKQLVELDGHKLLERAQMALRNIKHSVTVLGANKDKIIQECKLISNNHILENPQWQEGIASSIRLATEYAKQVGCSHLLLMTCDQPHIDEKLIDALCDLSNKNSDSIIACKYGNTAGIPAIFPARYFDSLLELEGDRGAKKMIESCQSLVQFDYESAAVDIDSKLDLAQATFQPNQR